MVMVRKSGVKRAGPAARPAIGRPVGLTRARRLRVAPARARSRRFFSPPTTQQVRSVPAAMDWLGGAAMLLAVVAWGTLLSLL